MSDADQHNERNRLKAGDRVGDHLVVRSVLGHGGTAIVYEALHTRLGALVALKVLQVPEEFVRDGALRMQREAEVCASIDDSHVPRIYDVGALPDGTPYVVMEKVSGVTLEEMLSAGPLPTEVVLEITRDLLKALEAVHRTGVVHRDIKPANIIVKTTSDGSRHVRLMDFGVSKAVCREGHDVKLTRVGTVVGTPHYMAPEQITGESADARADVYATGVVMFEMLSGAVPFDGESTAEIVSAVLRHGPARLVSLRPDVPPALEAVVTRAMAARPGDRYLTVRDFYADLQEASSVTTSVRVPDGAPSTLSLMPPPRGFTQPEEVRSASSKRFSVIGVGLAVIVGTMGFPGAAKHGGGVEVARADNDRADASAAARALRVSTPAVDAEAQAASAPDVEDSVGEPFEEPLAVSEQGAEGALHDARLAPEETREAPGAATESQEITQLAQEAAAAEGAGVGGELLEPRYRLNMPGQVRLRLGTELQGEDAAAVSQQVTDVQEPRRALTEEERAERQARRRLREAEEQVRREDREFERQEAARTGIVISDYIRKLEDIQQRARDESSALPRSPEPLPDNPYFRDALDDTGPVTTPN